MKNINKGRIFLLSLLIICFLAPSLAAGGKKEEAPASAPEKKATPLTETVVTAEAAAVVNGSVITIDEVERQTVRARQQYAAQGMVLQDEQLNMVRQDVLDSLVEQRIMVLAASDAGYSADPARVEAELSQIRSQFPSEEEMTAAMEAQGMTLASLTKDIEEFLAIQDFMDKEFYSAATASDEDAQGFTMRTPVILNSPSRCRPVIFLSWSSPKRINRPGMRRKPGWRSSRTVLPPERILPPWRGKSRNVLPAPRGETSAFSAGAPWCRNLKWPPSPSKWVRSVTWWNRPSVFT
jgi:hypothetical protein